MIIICGSSAGAEPVLSTVYNLPPLREDESPIYYAGGIAMAGAITDISRITGESAIPSMFFHGTCDNVVPYGTAPHRYCQQGKEGYLSFINLADNGIIKERGWVRIPEHLVI